VPDFLLVNKMLLVRLALPTMMMMVIMLLCECCSHFTLLQASALHIDPTFDETHTLR
jgi:hypothetical protein